MHRRPTTWINSNCSIVHEGIHTVWTSLDVDHKDRTTNHAVHLYVEHVSHNFHVDQRIQSILFAILRKEQNWIFIVWQIFVRTSNDEGLPFFLHPVANSSYTSSELIYNWRCIVLVFRKRFLFFTSCCVATDCMIFVDKRYELVWKKNTTMIIYELFTCRTWILKT
jgi:hypothetical protein